MESQLTERGMQLISSWPGLSRPSTSFSVIRKQDVDGRHKAGHDGRVWDARPGMTRAASLLRLAEILDVREGLEFDVVKLAVDLLDLPDIDVLHDVAGFRINRDRTARALPLHALHGLDQLVAVGVAIGLLQRLVDQVDAVVAAHRHEA